LTGHDGPEAQRQDGRTDGDRVQDLLVRLEIFRRAQWPEEIDLAHQGRQLAVAYQRDLTISDPLDFLGQLHVAGQDPVHVATGLPASAGAGLRFRWR
jgi:hypothetical protein